MVVRYVRVVVEVLVCASGHPKPKVIRSVRWALLTAGICLYFRSKVVYALSPDRTEFLLFLVGEEGFLPGFAMEKLHEVVPVYRDPLPIVTLGLRRSPMLGGLSVTASLCRYVAAARDPTLEHKPGYHLVIKHILAAGVYTAGKLNAAVVEDPLEIFFL